MMNTAEVFQQIDTIRSQILDFQIETPEQLEQFRIKFLGSKNVVKDLFGQIRHVDKDRKKEFGQSVNELKKIAQDRFDEAKNAHASAKADKEAKEFDPTLPANFTFTGSRHPISLVMNEIIDIFTRIGFAVAEEREIEDDWHNFTAMNTPEDHPARDMQDTFYLMDDPQKLLRTHTSSVQSRIMTSTKPPIRIIAPGRVYRNETISSRSHCQFHQVEGLYIDQKVSFADMKQTLLYYARSMYGPKAKIRLRPSYFPFTEPSAEVDVYWGLKNEDDYRITKGTGWLEIMGCGMVDPEVLSNCDIDPEQYNGFAFGMGIERQAMLKYKVTDIRSFFENDIRFLKQFNSVL